jgi:hypothetical protein
MSEIRGIAFHNGIAPVVQELIDRIEAKIGTTHLFSSRKHFGLKFALRLPDESKGKNKKAYRLFLMISPTATGARAVRPMPPKTDWETMALTPATIDEVFRAGMSWFYQVQKKEIPDEYQATDHWLVLAGGRYESKK